MTTALYRRYRPETFADVIGQDHVTGPLQRALATGRIGHAYLFSGPRGCGKTTSARILARCLNCEQGPTPTPCGRCDSCVALSRGGPGSVDVIEIDAASHGGVDDARELRERASYGPAQSRFKVYIIDEAHMVTPQGFNALLKIVEEPPEHVKFVFATTEPEKVIGTIRSRTYHYPFRLVPPAELTDYLASLCEQEGVAVAPGVLGFVIRAGGGSVRDSLSVLDQLIAGSGEEGLTYQEAASLLGFTSVELLDATIDALAARDGAAVFTQIDKVIESGHDPRRFVEDLLQRLRDLIIVAAVPDQAAAVLRGMPEDQLDRIRGQQSRFGPGELSRAADIVNAGLTEMTGATSPRLQLELICARVLLPGASGESGYAARLDRIERRLAVGGAGAAPPLEPQLPSSPEFAARPRPSATPAAGPAPERETRSGRGPRPAPDPSPPVAPTPEPATGPGTSPPPEAAATLGSSRPDESTGPADSIGPAESTGAPAASPAAADGAGAPAAPTPPAGELDVAALRRVWPEVLGRIYRMRRATWTFLSQHAQVLEYDGERLVLGIATVGLTNTFRRGNHGEYVRQALIDEIAVDVRVEGVPLPADGAPAAAAERRGETGAAASPPADPAGSARANPGDRSEGAAGPAPAAEPPAEPPVLETTAGAGIETEARAAPSREARSEPAAGPEGEPGSVAPGGGSAARAARAELARAKESGRQAMAARGSRRRGGQAEPGGGGRAPARDDEYADSSTSPDDEDVDIDAGEAGQAVIERVLGGRVLGDLQA